MFLRKLFNLQLIIILTSLTIFGKNAHAEIRINEWKETIELTSNGKNSKISIAGQIINLKKDTYHDGFTIIFDKDQKITMNNVRVDGRNPKYSFRNNRLKISFPYKKSNGKKILISYDYNESYDKINPYLRQEFISVPKWSKGATAKVQIKVPQNLDMVSLNRNVKKENNIVFLEEKVSKNGIKKLLKFTPKSSIWNVGIKNKITAESSLHYLEIGLPIYFYKGGQKNESGYTVTNPNPSNSKVEKDSYILEYKTPENKSFTIDINSRIFSGRSNLRKIDRNPEEFLDVDNDDWFLLSNMTNEIKNKPEYQGLPLYAKIGRFVNDYITYDKSLTGKKLSIKDILQSKKGVCVEYAKLFNALARMSGIPSIIVSGAALGEYDEFEGHSWNLIYYKNRWRHVDPTWNLMSGLVSSSHIYFYAEPKESIIARWSTKDNSKAIVSLDTEFNVNPG